VPKDELLEVLIELIPVLKIDDIWYLSFRYSYPEGGCNLTGMDEYR